MLKWLSSLLKDSLFYGIGFGVSRFLQLIVLPIIAKAMPLDEYGFYSNYVIFYTIAGGAFVLGMDNSVTRFLFDSKDKSKHQLIFSMGIISIFVVSVTYAYGVSLFPIFLLKIINVPPNHGDALPYVLFTIPSLAINNFLLSWFKWQREKIYFLSNVIGSVLLLLIPLVYTQNVTFTFVFQCIFFSQFTVAVLSTILCAGYLRFVFEKSVFISMLKYGFPWMLVFILGLSRSYLDRFFLTHYLDPDTYGVYNFSARISTFVALVTTAFDLSFGPLAFRIWNEPKAPFFFARMQSLYILFISAFACLIVTFSPLIIYLLGGAKYHNAMFVLPFLIFSAIPLSLINFSSIGMIFAKKSFLNTITLLIGFIIVLLGNFLLTPKFYEYGAVIASLIGHLMIIVSGYFLSKNYFSIPFNYKKDSFLFIGFLTLSILFVNLNFSSTLFIDLIIKSLSLLLLFVVLVVVFFREEYNKTMKQFKRIKI